MGFNSSYLHLKVICFPSLLWYWEGAWSLRYRWCYQSPECGTPILQTTSAHIESCFLKDVLSLSPMSLLEVRSRKWSTERPVPANRSEFKPLEVSTSRDYSDPNPNPSYPDLVSLRPPQEQLPRQMSPSWMMVCLQTSQCLVFLKVFTRNVWEWRASNPSGCRQENKRKQKCSVNI